MPLLRTLLDLSKADRNLVLAAQAASANAFAPYSRFAVGAAARTRSGRIYTGANLENASYGLSVCAEMSALTSANNAGDFSIEAIAIVGHRFGEPNEASRPVAPCGRCRQLIFEAGQLLDVDVLVLSCSGDLRRIVQSTISELLPDAFGPANLGLSELWPKLQADLRNAVSNLIEANPSEDSRLRLQAREQP